MPEPMPLAPVTLRAEVEINGQTYGHQWAVPRRDWEAIQQDEKLRATYENMLRAHLGAAVMAQLQPPVTAHLPTPLDEAVMQRAAEELETGCRCHNIDERCSGCHRCPDICHGCDG